MDWKKIITIGLIVFAFFAYFGVGLADSITNYTVSPSVALNENLTIYGKYSSSDVLCAFYIFDVENLDKNAAIVRLNDQYTFSDGSFYNQFKITEPLLRRGIDYNAITKCGTIEVGQVFSVAQKEEIAFGATSNSIISDFAFWTNSENSMSAIYVLVAIIAIAIFIVIIARGIKG